MGFLLFAGQQRRPFVSTRQHGLTRAQVQARHLQRGAVALKAGLLENRNYILRRNGLLSDK